MDLLRKSIPHFIGILVFILISAVYFTPQINGYLLHQNDQIQHIGMSKEISDFRTFNNSEPLWTNSAFSGMPAYQISTKNTNIINSFKNFALKLFGRPIGYMIFLMIGFYILLICFDVRPWLAIIGSIAFGLASFNVLYLVGGHNAKVHALSFIPPIVGSVVYAFRKNYLIGSALLAVFTCLHLSANHVQLTYYMLYLLLAIVVVEFISFYNTGKLKKFFVIVALLVFAGILGLLPTVSNLMLTYEYGKHTTRGKSELTISTQDGSDIRKNNNALDSDYIKQYSLGSGEVWSVVIPNIKGGAMGAIGHQKEIMKNVRSSSKEIIAQQSSYWGEQISSGGAFYYGASIFLLFVLCLFFLKDNIKWALLSASILAILLSMKYSPITDLFIKHMPLFNKFRDTKMMLILVQIAFPLGGILFLNNLVKNKISTKHFLYVLFGVLGLFSVLYILPNIWFDFLSRNDVQQFSDLQKNYHNNPEALRQVSELKSELIKARIGIFQKDCARSLFFIMTTGTIIYLHLIQKLKEKVFLALLGLIVLVDMWGVDKRYLNNAKKRNQYQYWVKSYTSKNPYQATLADYEIFNHEILLNPSLKHKIESDLVSLNRKSSVKPMEFQIEQDKIKFRDLNFSTNYRVLELPYPFNNARTSFYHKSIGGYHGAKLKKYQELIDFHIINEYVNIINTINSKPTENDINEMLINNTPVLNMLNTKYIIHNSSAPPIVNKYNLGNAWFVRKIKIVENANEEILSLKSIDKTTAILQKTYNAQVPDEIQYDSLATISLLSYEPNHLIYETSARYNQFAVFSEIYFPVGWNAYIDGQKVDYFKANYALRAMNVPKGKHTIDFKFEPNSYNISRKISYAGSGLILIFIIGLILYDFKRKK